MGSSVSAIPPHPFASTTYIHVPRELLDINQDVSVLVSCLPACGQQRPSRVTLHTVSSQGPQCDVAHLPVLRGEKGEELLLFGSRLE